MHQKQLDHISIALRQVLDQVTHLKTIQKDGHWPLMELHENT